MRASYLGIGVAAVLALALMGCQGHDQTRPFTVSELLTARDARELGSSQVRLAGFWSASGIAISCAPPMAQPGDLEIYCGDGTYGITEWNEPLAVLTPDFEMITTKGPHLTPWLPEALWRRLDGPQRPPTRVVVVGHFDDPRAAKCRPEANQLCRERFVIDDIL